MLAPIPMVEPGDHREMDKPTMDVYENRARDWRERRGAGDTVGADEFATSIAPGAWRADLGCGPGFQIPDLGAPALAVDVAFAMVELAQQTAPDAFGVQAELEALPFRNRSLGGVWAAKSYLHVHRDQMPRAMAHLHWTLAVDAPAYLRLRLGEFEGVQESAADDFPGRWFSEWEIDRLTPVVDGAGFAIERHAVEGKWLDVWLRRLRSLPDTVGPAMTMLVVGLNPSEYAADAGAGFARPGNRFWPAALAAGIVAVDRSPLAALDLGIGMTDLVKRASPRADVLTSDEYRAGAARVERLVEWLQPGVTCFVGLSGWRSAREPKASAGPVGHGFGGRPAYLMPSTSGANATASLDDLAEHLRAARALAG